MTTRKDTTRDRMAAAAAAGRRNSTAPAAADPTDVDDDGPPLPPRTQPVKVTVELQPIEHGRLKQWCTQTAIDLNLTNVAGAEVLRVLWNLALEDERLAARVRRELKRTGGSRRRS